MLLGLFDFKGKRREEPDQKRVGPVMEVGEADDLESSLGYLETRAMSAVAGPSAEVIEAMWDSLADELDELSLDDLDAELAAATDPEAQAQLDELVEAESLRSLVDAFVDEEIHKKVPDPSADRPEDAHRSAALEADQTADIWADAAEEENSTPDISDHLPGPQSQEREEDAHDAAARILADFHAEEDPADLFKEAPPEYQSLEEIASGSESAGSDETSADYESGEHRETPSEYQSVGSSEAAAPATGTSTGGSVSGVVSDEVVLALMHEGHVRVSQVYDASRHRRSDEPLWRAILDVTGVDRAAVLAEVARQSDYVHFQDAEDLPVANIVKNMSGTLHREALTALLNAGGVPVEIGLNAETLAYGLVIATDDPASPELARAAAALPVDADIRYLPTGRVDAYLDALIPNRPPRRRREALGREEGGVDADRSNYSADRGPSTRSAKDRAESRPWPSSTASPRDASGNTHPETKDVAGVPETQNQDIGSDPEPQEPVIEAPGVEQDIDLLDRRAKKDRVVAALFKEGAISVEHVEKALQMFGQQGGQEAIWRLMATVPGVDREAVFSRAAKVYAFPRIELVDGQPDHEFVMLIMETIADARREDLLRLNLLPVEYDIDPDTGGARLIFVTHDPARTDVHQLLAALKIGRFELRYASEASLAQVITEIFPKRNEYLDRMTDEEPAFDFGADYTLEESELVDETALEAEMSRSSLLNLFEASLIEAVRSGASDIHVYPNPKRHIEIHFRVDGRLRKWHVDEKIQAEAFLAVVKDNSTNVDRFERDAAQDGFIQRRIDDILIRFRVSVLPIASANQEIRAESVVIRVLDDRKVLTDLSKLGMLDSALERVDHAISQPHGMVILTGPTGSGKSTTLVAALHQVITPEVNVLTIEDPVEYIINGVRQIKLSHKLGLEDAIRAVLRHDPDIVMVGEMRDKATADLAIKLANTGHLTFSTLHTNDAPSAVSRLYKMGVEPFLLAYAINLIVAQRLIRQLCPTCKQKAKTRDKVMMKRLEFTDDEVENLKFYEPSKNKECTTCNGSGYKGRRAISETLYFSQAIRHMVAESGEDIDEEAIKTQAVKEGMLTLQDCARELVREGETSIDEMMRVTASE